MGYAQRRTLPRKKRRGPRVRPLCPKTKVLNRFNEKKVSQTIGTTPDIKEDGQECIPPPLLAFKKLDDVLVAVLGSQVQRGLPVPVPRLQLHRALCATFKSSQVRQFSSQST